MRILTERASPSRLGLAVMVGGAIGITPLWGLHLLLCIIVATLFKLNRSVTYIAASITVPWLVPMVAYGNVQLGSFMLHGKWLDITLDSWQQLEMKEFFWLLLVGSSVLGPIFGALLGAAVYFGAVAYRKRHPLADSLPA